MTDRSVLLVGSIPLADAGTVFDAIGDTLADHVPFVPDGETGERSGWIGWQFDKFAELDVLEETAEKERDYQRRPPLRLKDNVSSINIEFGNLGFAQAAQQSYAGFKSRLDAGKFAPGTRFQVCLPTPFAPVYNFVTYDSQAAVLLPYTNAIRREVEAICAAIPHHELALQWDVATEMSLFEGVYPPSIGNPWATLPDRLAALADWVPEAVSLGYHLCYGSAGNKHWKEPGNLQMCVRVANALAARLQRRLDWLHMPVPIDRDDDAYFRPLNGCDWADETTLYLGLVHGGDGVDGTTRRIAAASQYLPNFGLSAECGLGRYASDEVPAILDLHARCAGC